MANFERCLVAKATEKWEEGQIREEWTEKVSVGEVRGH